MAEAKASMAVEALSGCSCLRRSSLVHGGNGEEQHHQSARHIRRTTDLQCRHYPRE